MVVQLKRSTQAQQDAGDIVLDQIPKSEADRQPGDTRRAAGAIARAAPNSAYAVSAKTAFTPTRIWDDGTFTYFAFRRNAPVPAIFRHAKGRERTVNSGAVEDGVIRVSGVNPEWVLRLGDEVVCVTATSPRGGTS